MNNNSKNKKIKEQYRNSYVRKSIWNIDHEYEVYPNMINGCHKRFSKHQEKSFAQMHISEYKKDYGLKIRGRRSGGLACSWDDYPSYVHDLGKSWKHNSNRKNQYYKENKKEA